MRKETTMAFGQCKDMELEFVNRTSLTLIVPAEGHRVRNPGGLEGWNNMTIGGSITRLAPGQSRSVRQTLNVKCARDVSFEIHYSATNGRDFTQLFHDVNIEDKRAVLSLTHD
jgi:hypothetical protein